MLPAPRLANGFFVYLVGSPGLGAPRVKPHLIYLYRSCARLRRWPFHLLLTWTTTTTTTRTITAATARTIKTTRTTTAWGWGAGSVLGLLLAADSYLIVALIKLLSLLKGTFWKRKLDFIIRQSEAHTATNTHTRTQTLTHRHKDTLSSATFLSLNCSNEFCYFVVAPKPNKLPNLFRVCQHISIY